MAYFDIELINHNSFCYFVNIKIPIIRSKHIVYGIIFNKQPILNEDKEVISSIFKLLQHNLDSYEDVGFSQKIDNNIFIIIL